MRQVIPVLCSASLIACGGGARDGAPSATVRDSMGITIVESTAPTWTDVTAWRLSEEPTLTIGVTEGDAAYELYRVVGAVALTDGRIVIGTAGSNELRYYDAAGRHLLSVGREGSGPGEFQGMGLVRRMAGDSVLDHGLWSHGGSIFGPDGGHIRDRTLLTGGQPVLPIVLGPLGADAYLVRISSRPFGPPTDLPLGELRDSIILLRVAENGDVWDTLLTIPGQISYVQNVEFGGRSVRLPTPPHFGPTTSIDLHGSVITVGHGSAYELREFGLDGTLTRLIRKWQPRIPVTPADVDSAMARLESQMAEANLPSGLLEAQRQRPVADSMPAYRGVRRDPDGNLWVEEYRRPGDDVPQWSVFDPTGQFLGVVRGPPGFRLTDVGRDYVLGIVEDELEVERLVRHAVVKPTVD